MLAHGLNLRGTLILLLFTLSFSLLSFSQSNKLVISEFMAINNSTFADEEGDFPDWIEIYNPGSETISLDGWFLTDNPLNIPKWRFPDISLNAGEYLLVFASGKNKILISDNLHTNFKLSGSGEFLALVEPDSITFSSSFDDAYPAQKADVSYGLFAEQYIFMKTPSPGAANTTDGYITEPIFSHKRGFYSSAFDVILSTINSNYDIYYTLNGSRPTLATGILYTPPLTIDKTTVLSAVAIDKSTLATSDFVTQTYLFVEDIIAQSNNPVGYPSLWGQGYPADYEMDSEIIGSRNSDQLEDALKSLPTVSLVTDISHLFSHSEHPDTGGIYVNTLEATEEWERPVSMEYFDSAKNQQFQVNCGLRLHGGNGRKPGNSPKHSFRVSFRSDYGLSKLNYDLFEENSAVKEFNALVLRAGYNYSWGKNSPEQCADTDYVRDPFAKKTQLDMDRTAAHTKSVHLYLNGLYWGVYNISEKITDDFAEAYLGENEEDYDVVKDHYGLTDGNREAWDSLMAFDTSGFKTNANYFKVQGKNEDGTVNPSYQNLLDVRNLADYMLINFYIGNIDWDKNNWLAARNRVTNEHGFKFFCWDAENSMNDLNENIVDLNNPDNPSALFSQLTKNEEFRLYFADRIHKHFFNRGALTATSTTQRYMNIANEIDTSILAESARWGDYRRDVDPGSATYDLYTRDKHWLDRVNYMQSTYLPQRSDIVLSQLKDAELYPEIDAPVFSHFGGDFNSAINLSISAGTNTIYYTIDDSDPREIGGYIAESRAVQYTNPLILAKDVILKARAKNGEVWSALTRAKFKFCDIPIDTILTETICQGENYLGFYKSGTHYLSVLSSQGTDSIIEINLTVNPSPEVFIGNDTSITQNETIILASNSDFNTYLWNTNETSKNIEVVGSNVGEFIYWLQVEDDNGCTKVDTITITVEEINSIFRENYTDRIKVYPNPITDIIHIEITTRNNSEVYIEICNLSGTVVYKKQIQSDSILEPIHLDFLSKGLYILKIRTEEFEKVVKLMKE